MSADGGGGVKVTVGRYFSLPKKCANEPMALEHVLASRTLTEPADDADEDDTGLGSNAAAPRNSADEGSRHAFFKLRRARVGNMKGMLTDVVSDLRFSDVVVTRHEVLEIDRAKSQVCVAIDAAPWSSDSADFVGIMRAASFEHAVLWDVRPDSLSLSPRRELPGPHAEHMKDLALRVVHADAFPGSGKHFHLVRDSADFERFSSASRSLCDLGLLTHAADDPLLLQLTPEGLGELAIGVFLCHGTRACVPPATTWSVSWSTYECLLHLQSLGWSCALAALRLRFLAGSLPHMMCVHALSAGLLPHIACLLDSLCSRASAHCMFARQFVLACFRTLHVCSTVCAGLLPHIVCSRIFAPARFAMDELRTGTASV